MRTIKFRGYSQTFNSWLYGDLISTRQAETIVCEESGHEYEVDQNSVGQLTGLHDKNGKEIYEGDIIGDWAEVDGKMEQSRLTVYFDEMLGQWVLDISFNQDRTSSCSLFSELKDFEYEVIGNIYKNPELISKTPTHEH